MIQAMGSISSPSRPLTREAFCAALEKGQGRAWLHVRDHGTAGVEEDLLHACLHNLLYDAQCEDSRAPWLLAMVERSPEPGRFAAAITAALPVAADDRDAWQLSDLALELARRGDPAARQALYVRLENSPSNGFDSAENVIDLDGIDGLLRAAEMRGRRLLADPQAWEDEMLLDLTAESHGEESVRAALEDAASRSQAVRAYLDAVDASRRDRESPRRRTGPDLAAILADIEAEVGTFPGRYARFGKTASQEDVDTVFARLLAETRRPQQLRCLWVFRMRPLPRLADLLLTLAESADLEIQEAACSALAGTPDARVHALALRLLARPESLAHSSLRLFRSNLEEGDPARIEAALWAPEDREQAHSITWDLLELAGAHPEADFTGSLLWVAEHSPCGNCRARALKQLIQRGTAPASLLQECLHDADGEARELAAKEWIPDEPT
jgi:hypothetical protein